MQCAGSVGLSEGVENIQSEFAREGSAAHEIAERCLVEDIDAEMLEGELIPGYDATEEFAPLYVDDNMAVAVQLYLNTVRAEMVGENKELYVEQRFDLSHIYPDLFGTNDAIVYDADTFKMTIFDYKHGQGIAVEVERNPQLMYYALGALTGKHNRQIGDIELVIVQPRCMHKDGPVRRWSTTVDDLLEFRAELIAAAKATEKNNAKFKAGDWCKFCPAAAVGRCEHLGEFVMAMTLADYTAEGDIIMPAYDTLSPKKKAQVLTNARVIDTWLKGIKKAAHDDALAGNTPPGYRLVQSKPRRHWKSEQRVVDELGDMGLTPRQIFAPKKVRTPSQMEVFFRGKKKKIIEHLWENRSSGVSLVHEGDPRPDLRTSAEDEFDV
jgi:hypothetical protein